VTAPSDSSQNRWPARAPAATPGIDDPEVESRAAERVLFFSDAVVAIAITLLALALPLPASTLTLHITDSTTNAQLLHALASNWRDYLAFLISFLVIGNYWAGHRRLFRYVSRLNPQVTWLNMIWLMMMVLTPFATRIVTGLGGFGVRFTIYTAVQVIAAACLMLMSRELVRRDLLRPDAPESARHQGNARNLAIIVVFLVSIPVAFAAGAWAFVLWVAVPWLARALRLLRGHGIARRG
jgi:uncharacterized membrane protein